MPGNWRCVNEGGKFRVVCTKELPGTRWLDALVDAGCEVHISDSTYIMPNEEIIEKMGTKCDGVVGQLTELWGEELFEALKKAGGKVYSNYAVGFNNVTVPEATKRGIAVGNTPGVLTETTAEMAITLTFGAARRLSESEVFTKAGKYEGWLPDLFLGKRLWGGTVGIIGAGRIGATYAKMLAPGHQMDVVYYDLFPNQALEDFFDEYSVISEKYGGRKLTCTRMDTMEEVLAVADVVSLHTLLDEKTLHLIDEKALNTMKPDAVLVNSSRGPIIDEKALVKHLQAHPDFRAGLDVLEDEPLMADGLKELPNAIIAPHIASATVWTREGMATIAGCNAAAVLLGHKADLRTPDVWDVEDYLDTDETGEKPKPFAPSIVNAKELGYPSTDAAKL